MIARKDAHTFHEGKITETLRHGFNVPFIHRFLNKNHRFYRILPFLKWWPMVSRGTIKSDLIAGLTGAAIVLPQGVAFATIAGLPPEYGLYAAMVPAIIAALFGSSWHLVSGPTTAISIAVFSMISPLVEPGSPQYISLVLTLTFLAGIFQLILGMARMGVLVNFISHTVVVGFTTGAAILIGSSQLKNFTGIPVPRGSDFIETIHTILSHIGTLNLYVLSVGIFTLCTAIFAKKFFPRFPYMITAMISGGLFAYILNILFGGEAITNIKTVGILTANLPPVSYPDFSLNTIKLLAPSAFAITILALTEAISISRAIAAKSEQRIDGSQEFIGQGLSNIVGSFFSGYASSGSFNRSGLNYTAGARTPLATVFASFFLVLILFLVAPFAAYLPTASMAAILFIVAFGLVDFHMIKTIRKSSRSETVVLFITFLTTLFAELEFAIYIGVFLSLVLYLRKVSSPQVTVMVPDKTDPRQHFIPKGNNSRECPILRVVHIDGGMFFGAVHHIEKELQRIFDESRNQRYLLIIATSITYIDIAGAEALIAESKRRNKVGGGLYIYGIKPQVLRLLEKGGFLKELGKDHVFTSKTAAISHIHEHARSHGGHPSGSTVFNECMNS